MREQVGEEVMVLRAEEAFCGRGAVGALQEEVVDGGQRGEACVGEVVQAVVAQRQVTVAAFDARTRSLEEVGDGAGDPLNDAAPFVIQHGQQGLGLGTQAYRELPGGGAVVRRRELTRDAGEVGCGQHVRLQQRRQVATCVASCRWTKTSVCVRAGKTRRALARPLRL